MAVTQSVATARRALRVPLPGTATRRFLIGALLGVAVVLGALAVFGESYATRILPGTVLGAYVVGFGEATSTYFLGAYRTQAVLFLVFIAFLVLRPNGLMGKQ